MATLCAVCLLLDPCVPVIAAVAQTASTPATAATPPAAAPPIDGGWPRRYELPSGGSILLYQPQVASWDNQKHLVAFAAVSYAAKADAQPAIGTIKIEADTSVAVTERLVSFRQMKLVETNFQTVPTAQVREIAASINTLMTDEERVIALDRVLANVDKSHIAAKNVDGIKADPPTILFSKTAAVIVILDGEPIWSPIKENDLKFAVNTNWDLFQHGPTSTYYLRNDASWLKAADIKGPWSPAGALPASSSWWRANRSMCRSKARDCSGSATPRVMCSAWAPPDRSSTSSPADGFPHRALPARGRLPPRRCRRTSRKSRSNTNARACWPRCPGRIRRRRRCCSRRFRRRRASTRNR
jgi:hypothetical protein